MVLKMLHNNAEKAKNLLLTAVPLIAKENWIDTLQKNKVRH